MAALLSFFSRLSTNPPPLPKKATPSIPIETISLELYQIIHKPPFFTEEAPALLERVTELKNSTFATLERNLLLRALDVASNRFEKKKDSLEYLDLYIPSKPLETTSESTFSKEFSSLFNNTSKEIIANAFSYVSGPLSALNENSTLFKKRTLVVFPKRTADFFIHTLRREPFNVVQKTSPQGGFSSIKFLKVNREPFALKAPQSPQNRTQKEAEKISSQCARLAKEACIYMALLASNSQYVLELQAYSNQGLCLEPGEQDLFDYLGLGNNTLKDGISQNRLRSLFCIVARAIADIHKLGISHQDIKPENLIVLGGKNRSLKLCDFGFADQDGSTKPFLEGTYGYETLSRLLLSNGLEGENRPLPIECNKDCWSLGVMMFTILTGHDPFFYKKNFQSIQASLLESLNALSFDLPLSSIDHECREYIIKVAIILHSKRVFLSEEELKILIQKKTQVLSIIYSIKKMADKQPTYKELLSHIPSSFLALIEKRDPDGYLRKIILDCFTLDDSKRPTIEMILARLEKHSSS